MEDIDCASFLSDLRRQAETRRYAQPLQHSERQTLGLLHELQVQQVELELQNEALNQTQAELSLAMAQANERNEQLQAVFTLCPDGFVSFDASARVCLVSPGFTKLSGLKANAVLGLSDEAFLYRLWSQFTADAMPVRLADMAQDARMAGAGTHGHMLLETRTDVKVKRVLQASLHHGQGAEVPYLMHLRDVTHETEVDRLKTEFLATAAHELRTPMTSILGFAELLASGNVQDEKLLNVAERIYRNSMAMASTINEMLDLLRIESCRGTDFHLERTDLVEFVTGVVSDFHPPNGRRAPELVAIEKGQQVDIDRGKFARVLLNLLSNAYKFSPKDSAVTVELIGSPTGEPHRHGLRVIDRGIGMSEEEVQNVGKRFYRVDRSGSILGTGLGVSIVKEILHVMGGSFDLQSRVGEGTQVTLWLRPAQL